MKNPPHLPFPPPPKKNSEIWERGSVFPSGLFSRDPVGESACYSPRSPLLINRSRSSQRRWEHPGRDGAGIDECGQGQCKYCIQLAFLWTEQFLKTIFQAMEYDKHLAPFLEILRTPLPPTSNQSHPNSLSMPSSGQLYTLPLPYLPVWRL